MMPVPQAGYNPPRRSVMIAASMNTVALPRPLVNRLLSDAQAHPDEEVCGLIGARDGHATTIYPVPTSPSIIRIPMPLPFPRPRTCARPPIRMPSI